MIITGAGGVTVGVGLAFGIGAWRAQGRAAANCTDALVCNHAGIGHLDRAHTYARSADIFVGAGAIIAAAGVALWWTAPRDTVERRALTLSPIAGPGTVGVVLGGRL